MGRTLHILRPGWSPTPLPLLSPICLNMGAWRSMSGRMKKRIFDPRRKTCEKKGRRGDDAVARKERWEEGGGVRVSRQYLLHRHCFTIGLGHRQRAELHVHIVFRVIEEPPVHLAWGGGGGGGGGGIRRGIAEKAGEGGGDTATAKKTHTHTHTHTNNAQGAHTSPDSISTVTVWPSDSWSSRMGMLTDIFTKKSPPSKGKGLGRGDNTVRG